MNRIRSLSCCALVVLALALPGLAIDAGSPLIASGNVDAVIAQLRAAVQKNASDAESFHVLSRAYYAIEKWDDAISASLSALKLQDGNARYHNWLGKQYGEKAGSVGFLSAAGYARRARSEFERAVQLDPSSVEAHRDLSEYYIEAPSIMGGGLDKARVQADALSKLDPPSAHWVLARIAEKQKRFDEAEREFRAAIAASSEPARYWLNLASFYRGRGRLDDMQKAVTTAAGLRGRHPSILSDAAGLLLRGGRDFEAAIRYLREYIASGQFVEDAPAFQAHYLLGQVLEKAGRRNEAAAEYRAAIALAGSYTRAQAALRRVQ